MNQPPIDHSSHGAQAYQTHFQTLLKRYREMNDGDLSLEDTCKLRGKIALLKELIALPSQKMIMDAQSRIGHPEE